MGGLPPVLLSHEQLFPFCRIGGVGIRARNCFGVAPMFAATQIRNVAFHDVDGVPSTES